MKSLKLLAAAALLLLPFTALAAPQIVPFGGTGSTTLSGILIGAGTSPVKTLTVGSGLSLTGTTLTVTATNAASTTLLGDTNTWSGTDTFSNTIGGSISGNAATVTNGVVTTGTYLNPAWITGIPYSILTGTVPTWNQNTTGSAATLTTARTINGVSFNGSANIVVASTTLLGDVNTWTNTQGMSITGNAGTATKLATARTLAITGDLAYTSPSFDGSGNVTAAGTLATVNSNVGSFTNANITVNAKGLITAASNGAGGGGAFDFTPTTNFGAATNSTSTTIWDKLGFQASSTSQFDALTTGTINFNATSTKDFLITYNNLPFITASSSVNGANTGIGISALANITSGANNTGIGYKALNAVTTGFWNVAIGPGALQSVTTGFGNVAIGVDTLQMTTGAASTGIGTQVMVNTTGSNNTGVGYNTIENLTTGNAVTAFGAGAGTNLSSGSNDTLVGRSADFQQGTGQNNVLVGDSTGGNSAHNTNFQTIIGSNAGSSMLTGAADNTLIGYNAGSSITTGTHNIVIGSNPFIQFQNIFSGSNNIAIGYVTSMGVIGSNALNIQNVIFGTNNSGTGSTTSSGQIGIGTTSPFARFAIQANSTDANTTLFAIGSSTTSATTTLFSVDNTGHHIYGGSVPVVSSCGTGATIVGNDTVFRVLVGSTALQSTCTVTFAHTYTNPPICQVTPETGTLSFDVTASSTPTATVIGGGTLTSDWIVGHCLGYQ